MAKAQPNFRILDVITRIRTGSYAHITYRCAFSGTWTSKKDYAAIRDDIQSLREYKKAHPKKYKATISFS